MTERRSTTHGPRLDEALAHETEAVTEGQPIDARSREEREHEGPGEREPTPDSRIFGDRGLTPEGALELDEVNDRSEVARHLSPSWFPANRDELVERAEAEDAPAEVVDALGRLPARTRFDNPARAWVAITGHHLEQRAGEHEHDEHQDRPGFEGT